MVVHAHHPTLIALVVLTSLVLVAMVALLWWRLCGCGCCKSRRKKARYKAVSKFFPFSYGKDPSREVGVALPEFGPPKAMAAERETLLNESDEDSL